MVNIVNMANFIPSDDLGLSMYLLLSTRSLFYLCVCVALVELVVNDRKYSIWYRLTKVNKPDLYASK